MYPQSQSRDDLLRLVAKLQQIEASDSRKARVCGELLTKLGPYLAGGADRVTGAPARDASDSR